MSTFTVYSSFAETFNCFQTDLIDFTVDNERLWSLWRSESGESKLYTTTLNGKQQWQAVFLEALPDPNHTANIERCNKDPRQVYLEYIFYPGRFPLHVISKALCVSIKLSFSTLRILKESN